MTTLCLADLAPAHDNVLPFPRDAGVDLAPDQTLRRVRLALRTRNATPEVARSVMLDVASRLTQRERGTAIVAAAKQLADQLAAGREAH